MKPVEQIDNLIASTADWRGDTFAEARRLIVDVDPDIVEEWKYMGSPVWELDGSIFITGNIFKNKVKIGFLYGASLPDPTSLFNGELNGKQRRSYELFEGDTVQRGAFQDLVRAAIEHNRSR